MGFKKKKDRDQLWSAIENLKEERYKFLLESFKPGKVYHVDCLIYKHQIVFACCSQYTSPPMKVSHEGGVFATRTLDQNSDFTKALLKINQQVLEKFGIKNGATHSEFIFGDDGQFYFLETSSRVGGAHIPDMIEAATGVNIWREWARLEDALLRKNDYSVEIKSNLFAGLLIALAKEKNPDTSIFKCPQIFKFLSIDNHIGIVFKSESEQQIIEDLDCASEIIAESILNILPPTEKPTS